MASQQRIARKTLPLALLVLLAAGSAAPSAWADATAGNTVNANTGISQDSIIGNNSQQATNTGVAVNGDVTDSNLNNNQNSNTNSNVVQPVAVSQPQYNAGTGAGGTAALILPRNPLTLPNASMGRSNFGLQFGVQNNPGLASLNGKGSALGWFMQGGVTIPFGKVPNILHERNLVELDRSRENRMAQERRIFGSAPSAEAAATDGRFRHMTNLQGRTLGLNAYGYSTRSADKLSLMDASAGGASRDIGEIIMQKPRLLALKPAEAFSRPLNTGEHIGVVEVGREYPYLGHMRSGWVKILLPDGREAWASGQFEYVKFDYTEVDNLAAAPMETSPKTAALRPKPAVADRRAVPVLHGQRQVKPQPSALQTGQSLNEKRRRS